MKWWRNAESTHLSCLLHSQGQKQKIKEEELMCNSYSRTKNNNNLKAQRGKKRA